MRVQVYETGPLKGLPMRGPLPRVIVCPPIGDAMPPPIAKPLDISELPESIRRRFENLQLRRAIAALPSDLKRDPATVQAAAQAARAHDMANAYPFAAVVELTDEEADAALEAAFGVDVEWSDRPRPFRSATPFVVIMIACTLFYFAVRMLGLPT